VSLRAADVAICAALSAVIAGLALATKSLWGDEVLSLIIATHSGEDALAALTKDYHPPVYFLLLRGWVAAFGSSELALRVFQALQACAFLASALALFRRVIPEARFHPFWLLLAVSSEAWLFLPMLRYYALAATLALVATLLLLRWLESPTIVRAACLGASYVALLYTDYPSSFVLALHFAYVALVQRDRVIRHFAVCLAGGIAFLPWVRVVTHQAQRLGEMTQVADFNASPAAVVLKVGYSLWAFVFGETTYPFEALALACAGLLCLALFIAARDLGAAKSRAPLALLAGVVAAVGFTALVTTIISKRTSFIYNPSRTFYALGFLYLALGLVWSRLESRHAKTLLVVPFLLLAAYGNANWLLNQHFLMPVYATPWKEVLADLRDEPGVAIVDERRCYEYYRERLPGSHPAPVDEIPPDADTVFLVSLGRESTESDVAEELAARLAARGSLEWEKKYLPIDESYRRFKARLTGRDGYDAKVTVRKYRLTSPGAP